MRNLSIITLVTMLLAFPLITHLPMADATQTEWDFAIGNTVDSIEIFSILHNDNYIFSRITLPYVAVDYTPIRQEIWDLDHASGAIQVDDSQPFKSVYFVTYYEGISQSCNSSTWGNIIQCYKFTQQYEISDAFSAPAKFKPMLKSAGTSFVASDGHPEYGAHYRNDVSLDTTPGNGELDDNYVREKNPAGCSGWVDVFVEDLEFSSCTGQAWRVHNTQVGWMQSVGFDPTGETFIVPLVTKLGEFEETGWYDEYDVFANPQEDVKDVDLVVWSIANYQADTSHCVPGFPCVMQGVWIPNNL